MSRKASRQQDKRAAAAAARMNEEDDQDFGGDYWGYDEDYCGGDWRTNKTRKENTNSLVDYRLIEWGGLDDARRVARRRPQDEISDAEHSMRVWGINPNHYGRHEFFWKKIVNATTDCLQQKGAYSLFSLRPAELELPPLDQTVALGEICVEQFDASFVKDKLEIQHGPPYYKTRGEYRLKEAFRGLEKRLLDPLNRFEKLYLDDEESIRKHMMEMGEASAKICSSLILRAVVIWTVCSRNMECINCKQPTLLWNKSKNPWRQMMCSNSSCGAMYEVKQVGDLESRILADGGETSIDGGSSFGIYHLIRNEYPGKKMYLVMIDSAFLVYRSQAFSRVYVAEIINALPYLKQKSFISSTRPNIYSRIVIGPARQWFRVQDPAFVGRPVDFIGSLMDKLLSKRESKAENRNSQAADKPKQRPSSPFASMSQEELVEHHRNLRRKILQIVDIKKKKKMPDELTEEESDLLGLESQIKQEAERCRAFMY